MNRLFKEIKKFHAWKDTGVKEAPTETGRGADMKNVYKFWKLNRIFIKNFKKSVYKKRHRKEFKWKKENIGFNQYL